MIGELEDWLAEITDLTLYPLQPNAGARRVCGPARNSRLSRIAQRGASQCLPDPLFSAWYQSGQRSHGWVLKLQWSSVQSPAMSTS